MLRRFTATSRRVVNTNTATTTAPILSTNKRNVADWLAPFVGHLSSITAVSSTNLMFTPLGTVALIAMAYNVSLVGLKHLWYTAELPARDYVQDAGLKQVIRYCMLISLLFTANGLFCEV